MVLSGLLAAGVLATGTVAPPPELQLDPGARPVRASVAAPRVVDTTAARADIAALDVALAAAGTDPATRASYLGEAWGLLRVSTRLGGSVGAELRAVLGSAGTIARTVGFDAPRARAVFLEIETNRGYAGDHGDLPGVGARRRIGGLTYQRYAGQALRIMPLATFGDISAEGARGDTAAMLADLSAALLLAAPRSGALQLEYLFPYGGGAPPWRSAMASSAAISATLRAWAATRDQPDANPQQYLDAAAGFLRDIETLRDAVGDDVWYRLYSFAPEQRVLNADLQVTIGIGQLAATTGDLQAQADFGQAVASIVRRLPLYDSGGWSRYSETTDAPLGYHDLQTLQLRQLARLAPGEQTLLDYAGRFAAYRTAPPVLRGTGEAIAPFYPVPADGYQDSTAIPVAVLKPGRLTLTVIDGAGTAVAEVAAGYRPTGVQHVSFEPALPLAAGSYRVDAREVDLVGLTTEAPAVATLTVARDTSPPVSQHVARRGRRLGWWVTDDTSPWVDLTVGANGTVRRYRHLALRGGLVLAPPRRVPKGRRPPRVGPTSLVFRDSSGNALRVVLPAPRRR